MRDTRWSARRRLHFSFHSELTVAVLFLLLASFPSLSSRSSADGSFFANFLARTKDMDPDQRAQALDDDQAIGEEHESIASAGITDANDAMNTNLRMTNKRAQQQQTALRVAGRPLRQLAHWRV